MDNFRSNKRNFVNRLSIFMLAVVALLSLGLSVFGQTPSASPAPAVSGVIGEVKNIDAAANQVIVRTDGGVLVTVNLSDKTQYKRMALKTPRTLLWRMWAREIASGRAGEPAWIKRRRQRPSLS